MKSLQPSENNNIWKYTKSQEMLQSLSDEISKKFWISKEEAKKMLEKKTWLSLGDFRQELEKAKSTSRLNSDQTEELFYIIDGYKKLIIEKSKLWIETLKWLVSYESLPSETSGALLLKKIFPEMMTHIHNPQNISDQMSGWIIGLVESGLTLLNICYQIGKGIIKAPYDLYLIATWKWTYETWKRI